MRGWQTGGKLAAVSALGIAMWGCPKEQPATTAGTGAGPVATAPGGGDKSYKIAVIPKGTANQFWQSIKAGADAAGKENNVEIVWVGPEPENDIISQKNIVDNQVTNKVDGIVLAATDAEGLVAPVKNAIAKGIPVVTIDSGIKEDIADCYVATDNVKGGEAAADALAKEIGGKGKVGMIIFQKGSVSSDEREKGFTDGLKKYPGIQLVSTLENGDVTKAVDITTNMMTANPDIVGIFASNEPNGVGAANYLKQRKLAGKVKMVAFDASDDEIKSLQDATIQALIVQNPYQMGYLGVKTVLQAIKKELIDKKTIDSGLTVVTKQNMDQPDVQKLLHPGK